MESLHPIHAVDAMHAFVTGKQKPIVIERMIQGNPIRFHGLMPEMISSRLYAGGRYEQDVQAYLSHVVHPGSIVYDIGAHFGYHAQQSAILAGQKGRVICFEPSPSTQLMLKKNVKQFPNTVIEPVAITDGSTSSISFTELGTRFSAWNTGYEHRIAKPFNRLAQRIQTTVPSLSIDQYVAMGNTLPDVVKIDVENGELAVLMGAEHTIQTHHPAIIIECGDRGRTAETATKKTLEYVTKRGYRLFEYHKKTKTIVPHTIKDKPYRYMNVLCLPATSG